ncbi:MAG TPA: hypothetical protein VH277_11775 [Gemmatimonadaceae bacterium]|jgi:hypothetical protein|nr:hypothetical protein [Gemmatimonadaceae bacterium]
MTELFDTSRISDDDANWDAVAARIAARASARERGRFVDSPALWAGASILFAASLVMMMSSMRSSSRARDEGEWRVALAPADDVGRALAVRDAPPSVGALVLEPLADTPR